MAKRAVAEALLNLRDHTVSVQVLQEFYAQAIRPTRKPPVSHADATELIEQLMRYTVIDLTAKILRSALFLRTRTNFSYWDCAVIAAAITGGCDILYTEDMQHGREIEGVRIVNPFLGA